jgi:hypothetical protein
MLVVEMLEDVSCLVLCNGMILGVDMYIIRKTSWGAYALE